MRASYKTDTRLLSSKQTDAYYIVKYDDGV